MTTVADQQTKMDPLQKQRQADRRTSTQHEDLQLEKTTIEQFILQLKQILTQRIDWCDTKTAFKNTVHTPEVTSNSMNVFRLRIRLQFKVVLSHQSYCFS